eukprot:scaffold99948_cov63-Phaeocystis_antarctica.AAC.1
MQFMQCALTIRGGKDLAKLFGPDRAMFPWGDIVAANARVAAVKVRGPAAGPEVHVSTRL